jgi:hypothetical protein
MSLAMHCVRLAPPRPRWWSPVSCAAVARADELKHYDSNNKEFWLHPLEYLLLKICSKRVKFCLKL